MAKRISGRLDEVDALNILKKRGIDVHSKQVHVELGVKSPGINTWGVIDYLRNKHGYKVTKVE